MALWTYDKNKAFCVSECCENKTTLRFASPLEKRILERAKWTQYVEEYEPGSGYKEDDILYTMMYVQWVVRQLNYGLWHYDNKEIITIDLKDILHWSGGQKTRLRQRRRHTLVTTG